MLWNTFDETRASQNFYLNHNFEPGTGISDSTELIAKTKELTDSMKGQPHTIIKAKAIEYILDNCAIEINVLDWFGLNFCGWEPKDPKDEPEISNRVIAKPLHYLNTQWLEEIPKPEEFVNAGKGIAKSGAGIFGCDYDHSVPDWDSVIGLGFAGLLKRSEDARAEKIADGTLTKEQEIYYDGIKISYEAILRLLDRFLECAKKHINDNEKMPIMVECLENVRYSTPKTLYQYLMLTYLYHLIQQYVDIIQVRTLGNLDVDGYPYYKRDLEEGRLTRENAVELFQFLYEKYTNQGHIHAQPIYFGGFDENGTLINELSYIMLDAYDKSCIVNPKLFIKVMPNTPDEFLKKTLEMIRRGRNCIVFINEELGMKISRKLGRTEEETKRLVGTGCNNFASRGKETTPEHMYVNLLKGIELVFGRGKDPGTGELIGIDTGDVANFKTYDDFEKAYVAQTEHLINKAFIISDFYDSHLLDINPAPIYSASMPDSVRNGKDAYYNGVKYNNTVMFLSCHASAADSLMMVKKHVYDNKDFDIEALRDAILADWKGYEGMREVMLNDEEKFGNDIDTVDSLAVRMLDHFTTLVMSRKNKRGGHFVVNGESIWFAHRWASLCGATPDGRKRGDMLSKNMSAAIGQDRRGITSLINSVTKIDATGLCYGCPFDYILHPSAVKGEDGLDAMLGLLRTFMKRGGYGFQGNVQDAAMLRDAQIHPENHKNLQVRISGWSWFFTQMEKYFQDEFIKRAELEEANL